MVRKAVYQLLFICSVLLLLAGCGGGGDDITTNNGSGGTTTAGSGGGSGGGGTASATLTWTAPLGRVNGDPASISEIAGYKIYVGLSANNTSTVVTVADGFATQRQITGLAAGTTYYFRMSAYDSQGVEGVLSGALSIQIPSG